jgi:hypothetical protein
MVYELPPFAICLMVLRVAPRPTEISDKELNLRIKGMIEEAYDGMDDAKLALSRCLIRVAQTLVLMYALAKPMYGFS